jgi:protein TonB
MELKKSPKADLQAKRSLFLEIGLCVSLGLMLLLFGWSQREKTLDQLTDNAAVVETDMVEVTRQDQKPPEPVKQTVAVVSDIINVVKNDAKITTDMSFVDFDDSDVVIQKLAVKEEEAKDDAPFMKAEQMPKFQGGDLQKFRSWVQSRLVYPAIAQENSIQGLVTIQFVVERDGSLGRIQVLQSPDKSLADEAIRILKTSPKWTPGKQRGKAVPVFYTLPVTFVLQ